MNCCIRDMVQFNFKTFYTLWEPFKIYQRARSKLHAYDVKGNHQTCEYNELYFKYKNKSTAEIYKHIRLVVNELNKFEITRKISSPKFQKT